MKKNKSNIDRKKYMIIIISTLSVPVILLVILFACFNNFITPILAGLSDDLPDTRQLVHIRESLMEQDEFISLLKSHERKTSLKAGAEGNSSLSSLYQYETSLGMFDLPFLHDIWEVWIKTDMIAGKSYTSFLVRLGMVKDENGEEFFSNQVESKFMRKCWIFGIRFYNRLYELEVLKPYRLNITESDDTSSVTRQRCSREDWERMTWELHKIGKGFNFSRQEGLIR